jgi:glyoxylase-like metal-dependent hydrolase (beta-lactamase superfamily II)
VIANHSWFDVREAEPGIFVIEEPHHVERVKSYLIVGNDSAILVDTGMGVANIREVVERLTDNPVTVVNSHAHWDHVGGNHHFDKILIHPAEADDLAKGYPNERMRRWFAPQNLTSPLPTEVNVDTLAILPSSATGALEEGQTIDLGNRVLEVLHCPGHSTGGIVLLDREHGILFSTDVAYKGFLYAYDGDWVNTYHQSLQRLASLAPHLRVLYPSHGDSPIPPDLLQPMADALERILEGAPATSTSGDVATFEFGEIGVYLFPPRGE